MNGYHLEFFLYGFLVGMAFHFSIDLFFKTLSITSKEKFHTTEKSPKPLWIWLLLPLSPIAILLGLIVGLVKFFKKRR